MEKLPTELKLDLFDVIDNNLRDEVLDQITDYLSNKYGYCVNGFGYDDQLKLNIDWDTTD